MPNKIKEIFSDDMFNINCTLRFSDDKAHKKFLDAMKIASAEGRAVPVDGVTSVATTVAHQGTKFPLGEHTNITHFYVSPVVESIPITLDVGGEEKSITFSRMQTKDKIILSSEPDSIVTFNFTVLLSENRYTVNYKVQFEKAIRIKEVIDSFCLATAFLTKLYNHEEEEPAENGEVSLSDVIKCFHYYETFFKRLHAVENELGLSITPSLLNELSQEEQQDIEELYLLLCKKKVLRSNVKITSTDSASITMPPSEHDIKIGDKLKLTFLAKIELNILKQKISLYTANLIVNAIIKDVKKGSDGAIKILYGDTDSSPMYFSYSAFKTEKEAKQETKSIMQHEDIYINALTSDKYISQYYPDI